MDLDHATQSASPENEAAAAEPAQRPRRRRKGRAEAAAAPEAAAKVAPTIPAEPEAKSQEPQAGKALSAAVPSRDVPKVEPIPTQRAISTVALSDERRPAAARQGFFKRHGALAAGMALALSFGAYAGTQLGFDRSGDGIAAEGPSVNVATALPWKRDVAMASTQAREIGRLKEELRGVRAQVDALKTNPDQARQAQELRSLRASLDTLKEGLTAMRGDTANAIAQVSASPSSKAAERDQQRVEKIAERLERLERQLSDPTPIAAIAQKPEPAKPAALPDPHVLPTPADIAAAAQRVEIRPKVIQNYVLREVADGVALIEGPDGLREVWPGRGVPGAGKVTSIEKQAGKWVVITSEGLIEYRRDAYLRN